MLRCEFCYCPWGSDGAPLSDGGMHWSAILRENLDSMRSVVSRVLGACGACTSRNNQVLVVRCPSCVSYGRFVVLVLLVLRGWCRGEQRTDRRSCHGSMYLHCIMIPERHT